MCPQHSVADGQVLLRLLEELFDVSLNVAGEKPSAVALERLAIRTNEELLEVPGDVIPVHGTPGDELGIVHQGQGVVTRLRQILLEEREERVGVLAVHVQLLQKLEFGLEAISRTDVFQGKEDFLILAILLLSNTNVYLHIIIVIILEYRDQHQKKY